MKTTAQPGIDARSEAVNRNGQCRPPGPDDPAAWMSGAQWADELGVDPDSGIGDVLGANTWKAVRRFCRRYEIDVYHHEADGMAFADFEALPSDVWRTASPAVSVTRQAVADFAVDTMTDDPHEIGDALTKARSQRFRDKDRAERELKAEGTPRATPYTLEAVAAVAGDEIAGRARELIEAVNRRVWSTPKPHNLREQAYLITAGELYDVLNVPAPVIATIAEANAVDRDAGLDRLAVERERFRIDLNRRARAGDVPELDLSSEVLSVSGLSKLEPVSPLIEGFLYRGQLAELVGHPGIGKTFAALGMTLAVASGRRWCKSYGVPSAMPVVYVAAEGASGVYARVMAWCAVNGVDHRSLEGMFHVIPRAVQMGEDDHMRQLVALVCQVGAGLVVFDTRARCTVGLEENSATDQGQAIKRADDLNQQTGAAVLVVHHTAATTARGRGSTAWDGALYSSLLMTRTDKGVQIECAKHKDAPDGCTHPFKLDNYVVAPDLMPNADAGQRSTMVLVGVDPMEIGPDEDDLTDVQEKVIELVVELGGELGLTRADIVKFGVEQKIGSRSAIYKAVRELADIRGRLVKTGRRNAERFTAAPATDSDSPPADAER